MAYVSLSRRDLNVLEKIRDPESDPAAAQVLDHSLPKDPHIQDQFAYDTVSRREQHIVNSIQQVELQLAGIRAKSIADPIGWYRQALSQLGELISEQPCYASARNNRAQVLRRLYGDSMLLGGDLRPDSQVLLQNVGDDERREMASMALSDLDEAIALLSPVGPRRALSPQAARTLAMAHTQRAALYHQTSRSLPKAASSIDPSRREATWTKLDFEEAASRDFALGGRYGNEVAKGLAVSTNPTAKLCGQMVREAMRKEYGPDFGARGSP